MLRGKYNGIKFSYSSAFGWGDQSRTNAPIAFFHSHRPWFDEQYFVGYEAALREHHNSRRNNDVRQFRFIITTTPCQRLYFVLHPIYLPIMLPQSGIVTMAGSSDEVTCAQTVSIC